MYACLENLPVTTADMQPAVLQMLRVMRTVEDMRSVVQIHYSFLFAKSKHKGKQEDMICGNSPVCRRKIVRFVTSRLP